nr:carbamoyltransferase C-terminal domain-containing protein [Glycomyces dulcitolivorans]
MQTVLGLCSFTHDSSAALIHRGRLVGMVEEERLNGKKHTKQYPERAIRWLLDEVGIAAADIDAVAYNFQPHRYFGAVPAAAKYLFDEATRTRALPRATGFAKVGRRTLDRTRVFAERFPNSFVQPVRHHRAHQVAAFAPSGWEEAAVLVVDSLGEVETTTIAHARTRSHMGSLALRDVWRLHDPASLGYAYGAVTEHLGWRRNDEEGTVMALAALGDPARFRRVFTDGIPFTGDGFALNPDLFGLRVLHSGWPRLTAGFTDRTCKPRRPDEPVEQVHRDLAAALQERTEQVMLSLAKFARARTGSTRLCLGGGVATNCVAAGKIAEAGIFDAVFVPPAPGDAGTALGAAIAVHGHIPERTVGECYLGPEYSSGSAAIDLAAWPDLHEQQVDEDVAEHLARQLADGVIVGLFQGRLEAGPRALGNRSILASPLKPGVVERLNATVKFREPFRPFAPMVPAEHAGDFFTLEQAAPFMSFASAVTGLAKETIPEIVHDNDTARLQTVTAESNPFMHRVLHAFGKLTGTPVLINTSLNIKGKPICGTPEAALECLTGSGLDALLLEGRWISK